MSQQEECGDSPRSQGVGLSRTRNYSYRSPRSRRSKCLIVKLGPARPSIARSSGSQARLSLACRSLARSRGSLSLAPLVALGTNVAILLVDCYRHSSLARRSGDAPSRCRRGGCGGRTKGADGRRPRACRDPSLESAPRQPRATSFSAAAPFITRGGRVGPTGLSDPLTLRYLQPPALQGPGG